MEKAYRPSILERGMVVEAQRRPVESLAQAVRQVAAGLSLAPALELVAEAAVELARADVAAVRVADPADGMLVARAVAPTDSALAAQLAGSRVAADELEALVRDLAERWRAAGVLALPALVGERVVGSLELVRARREFDDDERALAELAAAQLALVLRTLGSGSSGSSPSAHARALEVAGEALAAGGDARRVAQQAVRVAAEATAAHGAAMWRAAPGRAAELLALHGTAVEGMLDRAGELAREALERWTPLGVEHDEALPDDCRYAATIQLGQPPFAVLQLFYAEAPPEDELAALASFGARAAHALRAGERTREVALELERTRALLSVVGEAISRLSLAHTLETAIERIAELLQIEQVGVYLQDAGRLFAAAGRGLSAGHEDVADRLLDLARGPLRARATIEASADDRDPAFAAVRAALREAGVGSALAVPLNVREEPIGLLVAYPGGRELAETERALLASLAAQLAVAVQNARLHEQSKELGEALGAVLDSERQAARQLGALYEISRSFAQSLSLQTTLDAATQTIVDVLDVDAAVIRVPAERGDMLVPGAVHVADARLADAVRTILDRPQPRPPRSFAPVVLDLQTARRLGGAHALLVPFLEKGSTAAVLPIATPAEMLAQLTILSLDPAKPISDETLATATTIAAQAALAIDNARLYQQQKAFAETIQRALLPDEEPDVPGLDLGAVYESAARVDVGGDVYDFLELGDGRLAVVLGDVTGHGIDATADMAMAKFVFRSLAREHSDPSDFLAYANEVVVGEIAVGKFITMAYLTVDPRGTVVAASAGHPAPRLVHADGRVEPLECNGLALGIDPGQTYDELRAEFPPGAAVVLYTDGVVEARAGRELYGFDRLDATLSANAHLAPQELARAVVDACRAFGGELTDDCAVVVIRRA
jgi:serine phosphatase RsbU (regulator of sigma subunit)